MKLWEFFRRSSEVSLPRVMAVAALSGLSNALLLVVVNYGAEVVELGQGPSFRMFAAFLVLISLYILTQRYILHVAGVEVERIIAKLRVSLGNKIRTADLEGIEQLGRAQIYASVNTETLTISRAAAPLMIACQGAILVLFSLVYIAYYSGWAFVLTVVIVGLGVVIHFSNRKQLARDLELSTTKENQFFDVLTDLLEGFKEVKLNRRRSVELNDRLGAIAGEAAALKTTTAMRYADYYIFTQVLFYSLIAAMVFLLPALSSVDSTSVTQLTASILFIVGPLTMVVGVLPVLAAANNAIQNIERLDVQLNRARRAAQLKEGNGGGVIPVAFETIQLNRVCYEYAGAQGFSLGPVDLAITRGETVFIVGGNGSGKSTLLKILTGLYYPKSGSVLVDGVDIRALGLQNYRELFSAVFSDYHLFHQVYGVDWDAGAVDARLREMELEGKTAWEPGRFSNLDLSTGQKKRLALIIGLLEGRPILVLDEWAADQDPDFRKKFYGELLGELKKRGKTIIAATHDAAYFNKADRVLTMDMGTFVAREQGEA